LDRLIGKRGAPAFIRSDNEPEFVANAVRSHLSDLDVETRFIAPGAPWENGYIESFNGTLRNELLSRADGEFDALRTMDQGIEYRQNIQSRALGENEHCASPPRRTKQSIQRIGDAVEHRRRRAGPFATFPIRFEYRL
jgi:transposase InsO family protein